MFPDFLSKDIAGLPINESTLGTCFDFTFLGAFLIAQPVKNLPAVQETWVQSLGQEDPLEKEMATHSSILAWKIPWMEEPGGLQSMGSQRVGQLTLHFTSYKQ